DLSERVPGFVVDDRELVSRPADRASSLAFDVREDLTMIASAWNRADEWDQWIIDDGCDQRDVTLREVAKRHPLPHNRGCYPLLHLHSLARIPRQGVENGRHVGNPGTNRR